ncbi:hypothetical protein [Pontixanthobacter sp.]|uniref:hypothetical protein n=1 Tax=Pontixanthobacter sp. TaxID=2792078 RepID=UPI003C7DC275
MFNKMWVKLAAMAPIVFALTAQSEVEQPKLYTLALVISDSGEVIGSPQLKTMLGETATFHIEPGNGNSYKAQVNLSGTNSDQINVKTQIDVTSPTVGTINWTPEFDIKQGSPVRIEYGNTVPGNRPLWIEFTLSDE